MKTNKILPFLVGVILTSIGISALAADSCSTWMRQANGTYWRTCVDNSGHQYCETADANGKNVSRVSCK